MVAAVRVVAEMVVEAPEVVESAEVAVEGAALEVVVCMYRCRGMQASPASPSPTTMRYLPRVGAFSPPTGTFTWFVLTVTF